MDLDEKFALACEAHETGQLDKAEAAYRAIIRESPEEIEAIRQLATLLNELGRFDEALQFLRVGYAYQSANALICGQLGATLGSMGREEEALELYDKALIIAGDIPMVHWNRSMLRLRDGDFSAWEEFRWGRVIHQSYPQRSVNREWDGLPMPGKTLFIWAEQGQGDTIQYSRLVERAREQSQARRVIFEVQRPLTQLLQQTRGADQVIAMSPQYIVPAGVHRQCGLMLLPELLGLKLEEVRGAPYLAAEPALAAEWKDRLPGGPIGVCWRGSVIHGADRFRSIPAEQFKRITSTDENRFVSLQVGPAAAEWWGAPDGNLSALLTDWTETAAAISACSLVITVDTAVAHLAGALGVPCWVLITEPCDYRWLKLRIDSPWYSNIRLFRQTLEERGNWEPVIDRTVEALKGESHAT